MMSANFGEGGEAARFEQMAQDLEKSHTQVEGGLYVPKRLAEERAQAGDDSTPVVEAEQQPAVDPPVGAEVPENNQTPEGDQPEAVDGASHVGETAAERAEIVQKSLAELEGSEALTAKSEAEFADQMAQEAGARGEDPQTARDKAKNWLAKAGAIAGMTFEEFQTANKDASMETFIKFFFTFDAEGRFGGNSVGELKGSLEKDSSDAYLVEILEKGDEPTIKKFFEEVLEKTKVESLDDIRSLIKEFNFEASKSPEAWANLEKRMSLFLNKQGKSGDHTFAGMKGVFARLESVEEDKIRDFFGLEAGASGQTSEAENTAGGQDNGSETNQTTRVDQGGTEALPQAA